MRFKYIRLFFFLNMKTPWPLNKAACSLCTLKQNINNIYNRSIDIQNKC